MVALLDRNRDGILDPAELRRSEVGAALRRTYDLNHDGTIDRTELQIAALPPHEWRDLHALQVTNMSFKGLDQNHDGVLTAKELGRRAFLIARYDANADGALDQQELATALRTGNPLQLAAYRLRLQFDQLDRNHDGRLTRTEAAPFAREFALLDRNNDAVLTIDEFRNWQAARRTRQLRPLQSPRRAGQQMATKAESSPRSSAQKATQSKSGSRSHRNHEN